MPTLEAIPAAPIEPWVDIATVARHIGFCERTVTKLFKSGQIPGRGFKNGKRVFYRFKLSEVDAAIKAGWD
jgi:hypothetical protein